MAGKGESWRQFSFQVDESNVQRQAGCELHHHHVLKYKILYCQVI